MKLTSTLAIVLALGALTACNKNPNEQAADNIEANADNTADMMEANVDNAADAMQANTENAADAVRNAVAKRSRRRAIPVLVDSRYRLIDYRGLTATSVAEERRFNPRLGGEVAREALGLRIVGGAEHERARLREHVAEQLGMTERDERRREPAEARAGDDVLVRGRRDLHP